MKRRWPHLQTLLLWALRIVIAGLFLYSAAFKLPDIPAFAKAIHHYRILPEPLVMAAAYLLPWIELWCAIALLTTPPFRRAAWLWILLLLVVFTLAKISALARGLDIACGCAGSQAPMTWRDVIENLIWIAIALPGFWLDRRHTVDFPVPCAKLRP